MKKKSSVHSYRPGRIRFRAIDRRTFLQWVGSTAALSTVGCLSEENSAGNEDWSDAVVLDSLPEISPITPNDEHYVVSYLGMVDVPPEDWTFQVFASGVKRGQFDLAALQALPKREKEHTLQCIESSPEVQRMSNAVWAGLPLPEILETMNISLPEGPEHAHMRFECADGYSTGLPASTLTELPLWLVWEMNGVPLPKKHGFPARILTPGLYGWKNPKQVTELHFESEPYVAPWEPDESQGDAVRPWAWHYALQGLVVHPDATTLVVAEDTVYILGKAYAGGDPVTWVGVSVDGGQTYSDAELTYNPGPHRWTLFRAKWRPPQAGTYAVSVMCRTESGVETTEADQDTYVPFTGGMAFLVSVEDPSPGSEPFDP